MRYVLLKKNDWNRTGGVGPTEAKPYPAEPVEKLIDWLRLTSAWRANPEALTQKCAQTLREIEKIGPLASVPEFVPVNLAAEVAPAAPKPKAYEDQVCDTCGQVFTGKMGKAHLAAHQKKAHPVAAG